jgi:hypothetical protein
MDGGTEVSYELADQIVELVFVSRLGQGEKDDAFWPHVWARAKSKLARSRRLPTMTTSRVAQA